MYCWWSLCTAGEIITGCASGGVYVLLVEFSRGCASEGVCVPVASYWTMYLWGEFMYLWGEFMYRWRNYQRIYIWCR